MAQARVRKSSCPGQSSPTSRSVNHAEALAESRSAVLAASRKLSLSVVRRLIEILEAETPANPQTAANQRLQDRLEKDLRRYFASLEKAMPMRKLAALYRREVEE